VKRLRKLLKKMKEKVRPPKLWALLYPYNIFCWLLSQLNANHITWVRLIIHILLILPLLFLGVALQDEQLLMWCLCVCIFNELLDAMDGMVARHNKQVSNKGKLLDPRVDAFCRGTLFFSFALLGWMPWWMFAIIFAREICNHFIIRRDLKKLGFTLPAQRSGKIKALIQAVIQCSVILLYSSEDARFYDWVWKLLLWSNEWNRETVVYRILLFATIFTGYSGVQYFRVWRKKRKELLAQLEAK